MPIERRIFLIEDKWGSAERIVSSALQRSATGEDLVCAGRKSLAAKDSLVLFSEEC